jgi:arginine exporter protein ArgO
VVASIVLAVLFLDIRLESFELSGVEVTVDEEWRFQSVLLVLDVYFLVNYYVVALSAEPASPRQQRLAPPRRRSRLEAVMEIHAYLPFVIGYGAAAWLLVLLAR